MLDTNFGPSELSSFSVQRLMELATAGGLNESQLTNRSKMDLIEVVSWLQDGQNKPTWLDEAAKRQPHHVVSSDKTRQRPPGQTPSAKKSRTSQDVAVLRGAQRHVGNSTTAVKKPTRSKTGVNARRDAREEKLKENGKSIDEKKAEDKIAKRKPRRRPKR